MCENQNENGGDESNADREVTDNGGENRGDHGDERFYIRRVRLCWVLPNAPDLCREIERQTNNCSPPFNYARRHIGAHLLESTRWMSFVDNTGSGTNQNMVNLEDIPIRVRRYPIRLILLRGIFVKEYDHCVSIHLEFVPKNERGEYEEYDTYTIAHMLAEIIKRDGQVNTKLYQGILPIVPRELGVLKGSQPAFAVELVHRCINEGGGQERGDSACRANGRIALAELAAISGIRAPIRITKNLKVGDEYPYIIDKNLPLGLMYEFEYDRLDGIRSAFLRGWGKGGPQSGIVHHFSDLSVDEIAEKILPLECQDNDYQEVFDYMDFALDRLGTVSTGLTVLTVFEQYARQTLEKMWVEGPKTLSHRIETLHQLEKGIRSQFELLAMVGSYTASGMDAVRQDISNVVSHLSDRLHMAWLQTLVDAVRANDILSDALGREPRM